MVPSSRVIFAGPKACSLGDTMTVVVDLGFDLGIFGADAQKFKEVASRYDGEVDVEVVENKVKFKHKRSRIELPIITDVVIKSFDLPHKSFSFNTKELMEVLQFASQASEKSEMYSYAGVVRLLSSSGCLTAAATDGKRVVIASGSVLSDFPSLLVPAAVINALKGIQTPAIAISEDQANLYFQFGDVLLVARRLAKQFPNFLEAVPKTLKFKFSVKSLEMRQALGDVKPVLDPDTQRLCLTTSENSVMLSVDGSFGKAETSCPAIQLDSDLFDDSLSYKLVINHSFLADFFNACDGDVIIGVNSETAPLFLESKNRQAVIMVQN